LTMASDGTISGTPGASGTFPYVVTVKDSAGNIGTINCSVTVLAPPSANCVAIVAVQGVAITPVTMIGSGGTGAPYTFSATGLPAGLTMASDGTISGTPGASGTFPYVVTVKDSAGNIGTINCSVTVKVPPSATCVTIVAVQGTAITPVTMIGSGGTGAPYTFSATGLPAGLTMSSTGTISGTPTGTGTFPYVVTVKDSAGNTGTVNCSVTVKVAPSATCVAITAYQNTAITAVTMIGSGGTGAPYTFSATGLPAGLTMSSTGTISGTPTGTGTFPYVVTVKDSAGNTGTVNCSVTVQPPVTPPTPVNLTCGTCASNQAKLGVAYSSQLAVSGGTGPFKYTMAAGSLLPAGLTLNLNTGVISGTPTAAGTFIFTTVVTDAAGKTDTATCTIIVVGPPIDLACGTCGASAAYVGTPYTATLKVTGGTAPFTFSVVYGSLPAGLTLNTATGVISGTPTAAGSSSFKIKVVDANGSVDTSICSLVVKTSPVNLDCGLCGSGKAYVGKTFAETLVATGGTKPYTYSVVSGTLPAGLTLNTSTGIVSGTPTVAGSFTITFKVVDANGYSDTATCTLGVAYTSVNLECGICGTAQGKIGTAYSAALAVTGGKAPYTFSVYSGTLPSGLTLNSSTGVVSGTPSVAGSYTVTFKVADANGSSDTTQCTIVIAGSSLNLDCGLCGGAKLTVGVAFSSTLSRTGGTSPFVFSIYSGSLPAGLTLNSSTGVVSGTPTTAGTYTFVAKVVDSRGVSDTTSSCTITVQTSPIDLQCGACGQSNGTTGSPYSASLAVVGGYGPFTYSVYSGTLPGGLTLNSSTGLISGTPTTAGTYAITFKVVNSRGAGDTVICTIVIGASAIDLQCGSCGAAKGIAGTAYSSTLKVVGGTPSFTFSKVSGTLPAGLTLNTATGVISGTPTTAGSYSVTFKVADSKGKYDTVVCTIVIVSPVDLQCGVCGGTNANLGVAFSTTLSVKGGSGPYTFSLVSGSLPAGVTLNATTGVISGTPNASGTYSFTTKVVDANGLSDTATCTLLVKGTIVCGAFTTYTQGGWGATPSGNNPGTLLVNNWTKVYGTSGVTIGGSYYLKFTSASAIANFLPQDGTAGTLYGSATNATSSAAGVLAGQVLSLQLSVDFSNKGITRSGLSSLKVASGELAGKTVAQVLTLANQVLGGQTSALPYGLTITELNAIIDAINNNFDGGISNDHFLM
ncbi:MAG: putative Ig domain-containing protein, partial [Candidatus Solibacter sp.]